jgi:hypothetical protein
MGRKIATLNRKSPPLIAPPRAGANRTQTPLSAPTQCPKKPRNAPNPSMHSPAANRAHRPLLSKSKRPAPNPPTRPKPRQTPLRNPCKTKPPANSAVPPLYIHLQPCYTLPNNCQLLRLTPSAKSSFQNPFNQAQLSHSSCRAKPSGFPVFRWVQLQSFAP